MFTGKNKEQFEKWLKVKYPHFWRSFYNLPKTMQIGVYLEYLDSVECYITLDFYRPMDDEPREFEYDIYNKDDWTSQGSFTTRQEALTEAFKKADELINND